MKEAIFLLIIGVILGILCGWILWGNDVKYYKKLNSINEGRINKFYKEYEKCYCNNLDCAWRKNTIIMKNNLKCKAYKYINIL